MLRDLEGRSILIPEGINQGQYSSSAPLAKGGTTGFNFFQQYTKSELTGGADVRGMYLRHYLAGGGDSGECLRAYATVNGVGAVAARGAHISLSFGTSGTIAGTGEAVRSTLQVPNKALIAGTYHSIVVEAYLDGTSADISGTTSHGLIQAIVQGGDQAARRKFTNFLTLDAEAGSGYMVASSAGEPTWTSGTFLIRCKINGTQCWLVATKAA